MSENDRRDDDEAQDVEDEAEPRPKRHTDATPEDGDAKEELFEAIDHFKNAASILFNRATKDPTVKSATKEAERIARQIGDAAEPATKEAERIARKIGDAAEPLAKQLTSELTRLTRDVMGAVEGKRRKPSSAPPPKRTDEEE
jgi:DNA-binding protein H-NS